MRGVEKGEYHGWPNAYFLTNDTGERVVLADVGPRVVHCALGGGEKSIPACSGDHFADGTSDQFGMVKMDPVSGVARHHMPPTRRELR